jgi:hypothetical protein
MDRLNLEILELHFCLTNPEVQRFWRKPKKNAGSHEGQHEAHDTGDNFERFVFDEGIREEETQEANDKDAGAEDLVLIGLQGTHSPLDLLFHHDGRKCNVEELVRLYARNGREAAFFVQRPEFLAARQKYR